MVIRVSGSSDIETVLVNGETAEKIFTSVKKNLCTWKAVLVPTEAGAYTVNAVAYNKDGAASEPLSETVIVTFRSK